ncbi:MAG: EAL domain-containing protein [Myxococcales bacterium]|nr:EAL domain-containing protein [Myxococcales bacterium]
MHGTQVVNRARAAALGGTRLLVVEDDEAVGRVTARVLDRAGAQVSVARSAEEAVALLANNTFEVVLSDIAMPGASGLEVLRKVRERDPDASVVLITGLPEVATAVEALRLGASDYLTKPQAPDELVASVARAARLARLARVKREALAVTGRTTPEAGDRTALALALERALGSLWMAFQPIVARDGSLYGYEALMRTREPALPHPGAVLEAAERLGALGDVGRRTRQATARHLDEVPDGVAVFLNLHASDLADPALGDPDGPLVRHAARLVLEVTERASLDGVKDARAAVVGLRSQGFRIAIDDLGAGYAGLTSFTQLEPDLAKLDMSLVRDIDRDGRKASIVGAMTKLCHELSVPVVAEGVETRAERDSLLDLGCDLFQGYLFAKPAYPLPTPAWPT